MTCLYTNANSLRKKHSEFRGKVDEINPDVIGVTEVWQKEDLIVPGYHSPLCKKRKDHKGGGVMLLVKDSFRIQELYCIVLYN